jgi:hypothetical protein
MSSVALLVSIGTFWLTLLRKGTIRMTRPTLVFFGPDGAPNGGPKVFIRTLLYSTAKRGRVIENMFLRLRRSETSQTFSIWVYGTEALQRGSGLFVGAEGIALNHHFLVPKDTTFSFIAGRYVLEVHVVLCGQKNPKVLSEIELTVTEKQATEMAHLDSGVFFDWGPDSQSYHSHVDTRPTRQVLPDDILRLLTDKG